MLEVEKLKPALHQKGRNRGQSGEQLLTKPKRRQTFKQVNQYSKGLQVINSSSINYLMNWLNYTKANESLETKIVYVCLFIILKKLVVKSSHILGGLHTLKIQISLEFGLGFYSIWE